jgi:hypothetical protein
MAAQRCLRGIKDELRNSLAHDGGICVVIEEGALLLAMRLGKRLDGAAWTEPPAGAPLEDWQTRSDVPDWLQPILPPFIGNAPGPAAGKWPQDKISQLATAARDGLLKCPPANNAAYDQDNSATWPELKAEVLIAALAKAQTEIEQFADPELRLRLRVGLQINGVRITGQVLRLSNANLAFSLRLIGCRIDAPLVLSNTRLVTLDLSGSALAGLDASFLRATSSVRLREAFVAAPADFAGASIHGYFDASDALFKPVKAVSDVQGFDADRGMLNLSQASIDNDVHLDRASIWGGLAMRGLTTRRSVFLDEATVLAPMAVLEALAQQLATDDQKSSNKRLKLHDSPCRPYIANTLLEARRRNAEAHIKFAQVEMIERATASDSLFRRLLANSMRARTSAIRGDGMTIGGSLFAHALVANGRVRMKYARINGSLTFRHARLRSIEAVRRTFDDLSLCGAILEASSLHKLAKVRLVTYHAVVGDDVYSKDTLAPGADGNALDLRECRVEGNVLLGAADDREPTMIDGIVRCDRGHFDGEFVCRKVIFNQTLRVVIERPNVNFDVQMTGYLPKEKAAYPNNVEDWRSGLISQLCLNNAYVKDNLLLQNSEGLFGLQAGNLQVGGDLLLGEDPKPTADTLTLQEPALNVRGRFDLEGAEVAGDCYMLFDSKRGPSLEMRFAQVKERLAILPNPVDDSRLAQKLNFSDFLSLRKRAGARLQALRRWAISGNWDTEWQTHRSSHPFIDLRNAVAGQLLHPPPAWPVMGLLRLHGFAYRRGHELGPLAPHPFGLGKGDESPSHRASQKSRFSLIAGGCATALLVLFSFLFTQIWPVLTISIIACMLLWAVYIALPMLQGPSGVETEPMAIDWLRLQDVTLNRYRGSEMLQTRWKLWLKQRKRKGNIVHALEPYTVAVKALREEGRWISANKVERERLIVRASQLSWRLHTVQKLFYKLVQILSGYGFKPARLIFANLFVINLAAYITLRANAAKIVVREPDDPRAMQGMEALAYAADLVIPAFGLDGMKGWKIAVQQPASGWFMFCFDFLHVSGLVLASVLVAALVARVSAIISRFAD